MKNTIKQQIEELLKKRKCNLEKIRELSESVRKKAEEVEKLRKSLGIRKSENGKTLKKQIESLELRISTENLPLRIEKELAEEIEKIEKRISLIKEIEKKRSKIGELEKEIKEMKIGREKLKGDIDSDIREVESLRNEMEIATEREAGKFEGFCLGDLVTVKKENGKKDNTPKA